MTQADRHESPMSLHGNLREAVQQKHQGFRVRVDRIVLSYQPKLPKTTFSSHPRLLVFRFRSLKPRGGFAAQPDLTFYFPKLSCSDPGNTTRGAFPKMFPLEVRLRRMSGVHSVSRLHPLGGGSAQKFIHSTFLRDISHSPHIMFRDM